MMLISVIDISRPRGFTLIEMMLVLVVISVMASMLAVSIGDNSQKLLDREARRLQTSLQMVADEAVMQGVEFSLAMGTDTTDETPGYQFLRLDTESLAWLPSVEKLLAFHPLDPNISLQVSLQGANDTEFERQVERLQSLGKQQGPEPLLLLLSSGEMTPFIITLSHSDLTNNVRLASDGVSGVELL